MIQVYDWEKPLVELEERIADLRKFVASQGIDFNKELSELENKAERLRREIYENLTPFQRVMMARHPKRPTALDYIEMLFEEFDELHGDRTYRDDKAIVGGIGLFEGQPVTVIGSQKGRYTKEFKGNLACPSGRLPQSTALDETGRKV